MIRCRVPSCSRRVQLVNEGLPQFVGSIVAIVSATHVFGENDERQDVLAESVIEHRFHGDAQHRVLSFSGVDTAVAV